MSLSTITAIFRLRTSYEGTKYLEYLSPKFTYPVGFRDTVALPVRKVVTT